VSVENNTKEERIMKVICTVDEEASRGIIRTIYTLNVCIMDARINCDNANGKAKFYVNDDFFMSENDRSHWGKSIFCDSANGKAKFYVNDDFFMSENDRSHWENIIRSIFALVG
jgi:hypothetical protein